MTDKSEEKTQKDVPKSQEPAKEAKPKASKKEDELAKAKAEVAAAKQAQYYKVRKGDTLGKIAARHGTSVSRLCKLNGINSSKILRVGERLRIR